MGTASRYLRFANYLVLEPPKKHISIHTEELMIRQPEKSWDDIGRSNLEEIKKQKE